MDIYHSNFVNFVWIQINMYYKGIIKTQFFLFPHNGKCKVLDTMFVSWLKMRTRLEEE